MKTGKIIVIGLGTAAVGLAAWKAYGFIQKVSNIESNLKISPEFSRIHGLQKGHPENLIIYFRVNTINNSGFNLSVENIIAEMSYINSNKEVISVGISPRLDKMSLLDGKTQAIDFPFVLNMKESVGLFLNKPNTDIKIEVKYQWKGLQQSSVTIFKAKDYFDASKFKGIAQNVIDQVKKFISNFKFGAVEETNQIKLLA